MSTARSTTLLPRMPARLRSRLPGRRPGPDRWAVDAVAALWPGREVTVGGRRPTLRRGTSDDGSRVLRPVPSLRNPMFLLPPHAGAAVALPSGGSGATGLAMRALRTLHRAGALHRMPGARLRVGAGPPGATIESVLADVVGEVGGVVVRLGRPRPHRSVVVWALRRDGSPAAIAKICYDDVGFAALESEYRGLLAVEANPVPGIRAPDVLAYQCWSGAEMLVLSVLSPDPSSPPATRSVPVARMRALALAGGSTRKPLRDTAVVARLGEELDALRERLPRASWLHDSLTRLRAVLGDVEVDEGAWHGDWVEWNMHRDGEDVLLWDWEHHDAAVLVGFDHVHYLAQQARGRGTEPAVEDRWLAETRGVLADEWGLGAAQVEAVLWCYLVLVNLRWITDREDVLQPGQPAARNGWSRDLLERVQHALPVT